MQIDDVATLEDLREFAVQHAGELRGPGIVETLDFLIRQHGVERTELRRALRIYRDGLRPGCLATAIADTEEVLQAYGFTLYGEG